MLNEIISNMVLILWCVNSVSDIYGSSVGIQLFFYSKFITFWEAIKYTLKGESVAN